MTPKVIQAKTYRIFITDNSITFTNMDHHVLMNEGFSLDFRKEAIEEVDIPHVAIQVNQQFAKVIANRDKQMRKAKKRVEDARKSG
jgi:ATP-dependent protease HslVU (ClpYQ) ATPase subunit